MNILFPSRVDTLWSRTICVHRHFTNILLPLFTEEALLHLVRLVNNPKSSLAFASLSSLRLAQLIKSRVCNL